MKAAGMPVQKGIWFRFDASAHGDAADIEGEYVSVVPGRTYSPAVFGFATKWFIEYGDSVAKEKGYRCIDFSLANADPDKLLVCIFRP